jgi:hypothetical protein
VTAAKFHTAQAASLLQDSGSAATVNFALTGIEPVKDEFLNG